MPQKIRKLKPLVLKKTILSLVNRAYEDGKTYAFVEKQEILPIVPQKN